MTPPIDDAMNSPSTLGDALPRWSTAAVNLPEHASNAIHTDAGAQAAGFDAALVAGVTTYAYLTHIPATVWGLDWLRRGGATVRFRHPVLDGDAVTCCATANAVTATVDDAACAEATFEQTSSIDASPATHSSLDERLRPVEFELDESWSDYGERAGDDCELYRVHRIAHPSSWPRIANDFFHEQLVTGSWIHVRSRIAHHALAPIGATIRAEATVIDRFESRAGRRAVASVAIRADDELVATVDHEAIIELAAS